MNPKYILLLMLGTLLYSCKKHSCVPRIIERVHIPKVDSFKITDTAAKIIRYVKGSDFNQRIDSSFAVIYHKASGGTYFGAGFVYDFSDVSHDYMIILLPSGTTHKIQNIQYGNEKYTSGPMAGGGTRNDPSVSCSYVYTHNGKVVTNKSDSYYIVGSRAEIEL
jgi:hypothetical protein